ncbi:MAG: hypothetical protein GC180_06250 [Bacteroidetes bacterium]|nr:hypothetical protein [Bacteroidota bacterium]
MDSKNDIKNKHWLAEWSQVRKRGFLRFWMIYGLLYFILTFAVFMTLIYVFDNPIPALQVIIGNNLGQYILSSLVFGLLLSLLRWILSELRYRRLGAKYPNATRHF